MTVPWTGLRSLLHHQLRFSAFGGRSAVARASVDSFLRGLMTPRLHLRLRPCEWLVALGCEILAPSYTVNALTLLRLAVFDLPEWQTFP